MATKLIISLHHPTSKAKQSKANQIKTKQNKDWGEINLLAENPNPKTLNLIYNPKP